jgi:hypothetical protein
MMKTLLIVTSVIVAGLVIFAAYRVGTHRSAPSDTTPAVTSAPANPAGALRGDRWMAPEPSNDSVTMSEEQEFQQAETITDSRQEDLNAATRRVRTVLDAVNKER